MSNCKTIHLSCDSINLALNALIMAEARERVDAERYERSAEQYDERSYGEEYRDKLLFAAADCCQRSEAYRRAYDALWAEVMA